MRSPSSITRDPIDVDAVQKSVKDDLAGGTVMFVGRVRRRNEGKEVRELTYDVYAEMAEKRMREIEKAVRRKWPVIAITMVHRYGRLKVGEVSVAVAVSCEHREEAFEACRFAIDSIKDTLPIWKKEKLSGGRESWVQGAPIGR